MDKIYTTLLCLLIFSFFMTFILLINRNDHTRKFVVLSVIFCISMLIYPMYSESLNQQPLIKGSNITNNLNEAISEDLVSNDLLTFNNYTFYDKLNSTKLLIRYLFLKDKN